MFGVRGSCLVAALASLMCALALLVMAPNRALAQRPDSVPSLPAQRALSQTPVEARLAILTRPEVTQQLAKFARTYFDALVGKGFTREEAVRIVAGATAADALR